MWFGQFVPRWVILDTTMGGIKFVRGSRVVILKPGVHWYWPVTTMFQVYPTARQADDLRSQTMVTTDDKVIIVGGMIVYGVDDLEPLLAHTFDAATTIKEIALSAIHDVCCSMTWQELKDEQRRGTLDTKLKHATKRALAGYGVNVEKVMLTDLAPARVLKIMQAVTKDE